MTVIGKYRLLTSLTDDRWGVEWVDKSNQVNTITIHNLIGRLNDIVSEEVAMRKHFVELFKQAMAPNTDEFFNNPDHEVMNYMHDHEMAPDKSLAGDELHEFYVRRFLKAYNRWKRTSIQYREVENLCRLNT